MKIKVYIEIEKNLYEKVKNLESIGELQHTDCCLETKSVSFDRFIEIQIEKMFKFSKLTEARKVFDFNNTRKNVSFTRALQIVASLYSKRVADQIEKEQIEKEQIEKEQIEKEQTTVDIVVDLLSALTKKQREEFFNSLK